MEASVSLTPQMVLVLAIIGLTVYMFVTEIVRVDVAAIVIMTLIGLTNLFQSVAINGKEVLWLEHHFPVIAKELPWLNQVLAPMVPANAMFSGFSSNAVISIIAVMIIGRGLDKTGVMSRVAAFILRVGGSTEKRIIPMISGTVGVISGFMQNVGAAALFLPAVSRISARTQIPLSRLLMPMGFCAILGGTITLVGSSPLILLNDLILTANTSLPPGTAPMETFKLFDVTPVGLALVAAGIGYFILAGRLVLPARKSDGSEAGNTLDYFHQTYGLEGEVFEAAVPSSSSLADKSIDDYETLGYHVSIIAMHNKDGMRVGPARDLVLHTGTRLALMGGSKAVSKLIQQEGLIQAPLSSEFSELLATTQAGIAELVIPPRSHLVSRTLSDVRMRKTYGLNVLVVYRGKELIRENLRDLAFQAGDTLVCHCKWNDLAALQKNRDFVIVTSDYPHEELRPHKVPHALFFFTVALSLVLFTDLRLSAALFVGAIGMIISGVLKIEEAYDAVDWKTVFLLASLIPLGLAVDDTGTAAWIAHQTLELMGDVPTWVVQAAIGILATIFTLVMSNVGATVLLVPLAVSIALQSGADPRLFALTVALATSNSFLIPTHQVNALIMGPAGYRVADFIRAGGIMTVLFLIVIMVMLNAIAQ
jgi:di/tricarboxylate transporter